MTNRASRRKNRWENVVRSEIIKSLGGFSVTTSDSCDLRLPMWHILFRMTKKKKNEVTSVFQETVTRTTWSSPHLPHSPESWM